MTNLLNRTRTKNKVTAFSAQPSPQPSPRGRGSRRLACGVAVSMAISLFANFCHADDLWVENVCAENTFEYYNNRDTPLPKADKPEF